MKTKVTSSFTCFGCFNERPELPAWTCDSHSIKTEEVTTHKLCRHCFKEIREFDPRQHFKKGYRHPYEKRN